MKRVMLCLVVLLAVVFSTSAQKIRLIDGGVVSVDLTSVILDSVHAYAGIGNDGTDISISNITINSGYKMTIVGELVDSAFRPQIVWLDVPEEIIPLFPEAFGSFGNRINVSYICKDNDFYFASNFLFKDLMKKGSWEVVSKKSEKIGEETITDYTTIQLSGAFPTSGIVNELSLRN